MFRGVRIVFRGLSDTLENLLHFVGYTVAWWLCVFTVVLGPGATVALFAAVDPRIVSSIDRPGPRELFRSAVGSLRRGWILALITIPVLGVLFYNLWYYGSRASGLALLAPAWFALLLVGAAIATSAFAIAALFDQSPLAALRTATILTGARLWNALVVAVLLWVLIVLGAVLVVPLFMFLPAAVAAAINRLVLDGLGIPVADPLAPTDERMVEEARTKEARKFGP
jgi:hypothetical protein